MRKTYKYRIYPSRLRAATLEGQLDEARRLYNGALQERRDAWRVAGVRLNYYDQAKQLREIRAEGGLELANFSSAQDVLRHVDKSFKAFFRRAKERQGKAGYPRFKSRDRFDSNTFPSYGDGVRLLESGRLRVQGVGVVKVKLHRRINGRIKTVTLKREVRRWYVAFSVECAPEPLPASLEVIGIDVGLAAFATLSDGTAVENPRFGRAAMSRLRIAQRKVARRKRRSRRRRKAVRALAAAHAHVRQQRADFHHKVSRQIVNTYGFIAVEDLNVKGLAGGMLARSVHDAGWSAFLIKLAYREGGSERNEPGVSVRRTRAENTRTEMARVSGLRIVARSRSRIGSPDYWTGTPPSSAKRSIGRVCLRSRWLMHVE